MNQTKQLLKRSTGMVLRPQREIPPVDPHLQDMCDALYNVLNNILKYWSVPEGEFFDNPKATSRETPPQGGTKQFCCLGPSQNGHAVFGTAVYTRTPEIKATFLSPEETLYSFHQIMSGGFELPKGFSITGREKFMGWLIFLFYFLQFSNHTGVSPVSNWASR